MFKKGFKKFIDVPFKFGNDFQTEILACFGYFFNFLIFFQLFWFFCVFWIFFQLFLDFWLFLCLCLRLYSPAGKRIFKKTALEKSRKVYSAL